MVKKTARRIAKAVLRWTGEGDPAVSVEKFSNEMRELGFPPLPAPRIEGALAAHRVQGESEADEHSKKLRVRHDVSLPG